ncbi:PIN domain-containing protein [Spectribacter hydrogenooxidans]|uniref:PIN domain-containing protein n=1 Tax=Spectribacter hydrogenoxidans TaxID=3075608 RepID=A0ABU3BWH9_9GAMM|nr:PIN domain-containing protein [Salinisphaera sp. W335]MDT0633647.1 PIN domain-containing protein [Salinisphaera sp. W335]
MRLIVTDANIFIDMAAGELLESMFALRIEFAVPDILYLEELHENYATLPGLGLRVWPMSETVVADAEVLRTRYRKPGQNDLFALALARSQQCPLLTGDRDLRLAAEQEEAEVHGTLWLVERMVQELDLALDTVERAYRLMEEDGSRLPWPEVRRQLRRLAKTQEQ